MEQQGKPAAVSADADAAAARAQVEGGLKATTWAAEPLLKNPVAFSFDGQGRCYVAETGRLHDGVPDTRGFMHWLDDDIGSRSVADRLALFQKHKYPAYEKFGETVRMVWDGTGKGKATESKLFAGPFNQPADGVIAGVLAHGADVFVGCIPTLSKFDAAGKQTVLSSGYGIRNQFIGHDLHGLVMGPDGKLYFSIGDRGLNVSPTVQNLDSGAVLRCDPDGNNLELVHTGLRNPQELAFDDLGNLFTYDNNSDSGDKARWVQVVEGGDSGWRCGYQYGTLMHYAGVPQGNRGPWNTEKIWHVPGPDGSPPAYVVPPLAHFGNGPSGLTAYPGVGLSDRYKGHFFACDFTSSPSNSVIWSLAVKPKGASFEVVDRHEFVRNMVPTDCEFGPDGAFYWLDWTGGWNKPEKGRIFRVADEAALKHQAAAEAKQMLAEGFGKKSADELARLLGHPHRGVRQGVQFELAKRPEAVATFEKVLRESKERTPRLHAVWGLSRPPVAAQLAVFAADPDAEVRLNVARGLRVAQLTAGGPLFRDDAKLRAKTSPVVATGTLLADPDARVRAAAAVSYGALMSADLDRAAYINPGSEVVAYAPLLDLLRSNADADPYIRQAAVEGLVRATKNPDDLFNAWKLYKQDAPAVRLGVVLALRKLQGKHLADFLTDAEPQIVAEAARAVYDADVPAALPALAKLADTTTPEPVAYRALAANFRLGGAENAARVAAFAARSGELPHLREAALKLLADWTKPKRLDPITGLRQNLPERPASRGGVGPHRGAAQAVRRAGRGPQGHRGVVAAKLEAWPGSGRCPGSGLVADDKTTGRQPGRGPGRPPRPEVRPELPAAVEVAAKSSAPRLRAAAAVDRVRDNPPERGRRCCSTRPARCRQAADDPRCSWVRHAATRRPGRRGPRQALLDGYAGAAGRAAAGRC